VTVACVALFPAILLLGAAAGGEGAAPPAGPLRIKAWRGKGKPAEYDTRILRHLADFAPKEPTPLSKFGGWLGEKHKATGFFRVEKLGDRWWLIDPEGCRYLHIAVNAVRPGKSPKNLRTLPAKFGTVEKWRDATVALLRDLAFNGTGSWSDDALNRAAAQPLAYTPNWNFMSSYGKKRGGTYQLPGHTGYPNNCIFAFDPEFEAFADEHAKQLAATKDDPWLLGHFSDNEMPFPRDSLDRYLALKPDDPGRRAAEAWLAGRGLDRAKLTARDRDDWLGHVAERYFSIVARAIRKHDPNHLYLGSRFHSYEKGCQPVFAAAGRHLDAVAVNVYGVWTPSADMLQRWAAWAGKPSLITEWYAKGADTGMPNITGAGWTVATQQERGWFYQNFTLALLESRACVGWHWFKYMDNDPEDTTTDPSNRDSNKGIVTATYEPHVPLMDAMRELNRAAYPLTAYFDRRR